MLLRAAAGCPRRRVLVRRMSFAVVAILALAALGGTLPVVGADQTFKIIVNQDVQGTQIPRHVLSSIFLRGVLRWGDGHAVKPVDQSMRSPVREAFTQQVLAKRVEGMAYFWSEKIRNGVTPPPVKSSDADVIDYVASNEGAIGYVSASTPVPASVKSLEIID
jgi:ABC-type phosphate transport system substrate-binding protein